MPFVDSSSLLRLARNSTRRRLTRDGASRRVRVDDAADDAPADPYAAHELPVSRYAGEIVAAVRENPVVVVIGETGSGKTTQMAQILHRAATLMPAATWASP